MPRYHYQALNAEGISLEGMLRANNEREAARALERRGLSVIEVRSGEAFAGMSRDLQRGQAFSATLAKCGLPLPEYVVQLARAG